MQVLMCHTFSDSGSCAEHFRIHSKILKMTSAALYSLCVKNTVLGLLNQVNCEFIGVDIRNLGMRGFGFYTTVVSYKTRTNSD